MSRDGFRVRAARAVGYTPLYAARARRMGEEAVIRPGDALLHYRFLDTLGEGGGGVVWRALDTRLNREVAVKFVPEGPEGSGGSAEGIEREARALAALSHANIVTVYAVEEVEGRRFFAMELVRGKTLDEMLPADGLPLKRVLDLAAPLADALAAAHERGIVHRDLKPRNVIVAEDGKPKILDFGLASVRAPDVPGDSSESEGRTRTGPGRFFGTAPYMSPEQARGETTDARSDVFSFGVMLYEMSTGRLPFRGESPADLLASILRDAPDPVSTLRPDLPAEFERILDRCLEKDPSLRYQSTFDLRNEIESLRQRKTTPREHGPSVAVLPFADLSREKDQGYFCDGVADEILSALSRVQGLRVASRTSSFRLRNESLDSREIGRRLGVRTLLEGSVRKAGDHLRVTAELVDPASGFGLWSQTFDGDLADVFAIQEGIARSIAGALRVTLSLREHEALGRPPTTDFRAYDCYLRGRSYYYQYRRHGVEFALRMFRRAIELDPSYARAWAGVADCYCFFFLYVSRVEENIRQAEAASRKALDLDFDLAEAQASWGVAMSIAGRDREAVESFERAIRLDPGLFEARYFYARHCFAQGDLPKSARLYEEAETVRPEDYQSPLLVSQVYESLGRGDLAESARRRGLRKAEERLKLQPDDTRARYMGANALVGLGDRERGLEWARAAEAAEPDEPMLLYNIGCIYSLAGRTEEALEVLIRSVDLGLTQRGWFEHDNNLDPLRAHPRFEALMARLSASG